MAIATMVILYCVVFLGAVFNMFLGLLWYVQNHHLAAKVERQLQAKKEIEIIGDSIVEIGTLVSLIASDLCHNITLGNTVTQQSETEDYEIYGVKERDDVKARNDLKDLGTALKNLDVSETSLDMLNQLRSNGEILRERLRRFHYCLQQEENMPNDELQKKWDIFEKQTSYPREGSIPKWVVWKVTAFVDEITETVQRKSPEGSFLSFASEEIRVVNETFNDIKEKWGDEFKSMLNPIQPKSGEQNSVQNPHVAEKNLKRKIKRTNGSNVLDLHDHGLIEVPQSVFQLQEISDITELDISGNFIHTLPPEMKKLKSLSNLKACANFLTEVDIDILKDLPLRTISFSCNELTHFPSLPTGHSCYTHLTYINLRGNQLNCVPQKLAHVQIMDIGHNENLHVQSKAKQCHSDFDELQIVRADNCKLMQIPHLFLVKTVKLLNINNNLITSIPNSISELVELSTLLMRANQLQELPFDLTQCKKLTRLDVQDNKKMSIPKEVTQEGAGAIKAYLHDLNKFGPTLDRWFRVPLLGETGAGKSSFVRSLIEGQSKVTNEQERTYIVEKLTWVARSKKKDADLYIQFDDFGGHECYNQIHALFLSKLSTPVIFARMDTCTDETFVKLLKLWMKITSSSIPNAIVHLVATHSDLCEQDVNEKLLMMETKAHEYDEFFTKQVQKKLDGVNRRLEHSPVQLPEDLRLKQNLTKLLAEKPTVMKKIHAISSTRYQGIQDVGDEIISVIENTDLYPEEKIPKSWDNFRQNIYQFGQANMKKRNLKYEDVCKLAQTAGIEEESIPTALKYLHRCRDVLWFTERALKTRIFHEPNRLVELLRTLIAHDLSDLERDHRFEKIPEDEFNKEKDQMLKQGLVSKKMLECIWKEFDLNPEQFESLQELLLKLDLCFSLPRGEKVYDTSKTDMLMFPWILPDERPKSIPGDIFRDDKKHISIKLEFVGLCPSSYFPSLSVRLDKFVRDEERKHWKNGVYATDINKNTLLIEQKFTDSIEYIQLTVCGAQLYSMWQLVLPIHLEMRNLLRKWPGIVGDFCVLCPRCHGANNCLFSAEHLWKPFTEKIYLRCRGPSNARIDPFELYPAKEVLNDQKEATINYESGESPEENDMQKDKNYRLVRELLMEPGLDALREILWSGIQPSGSLDQWLLDNQPVVHKTLKDGSMDTYKYLYNKEKAIKLSDLRFDTLQRLLTVETLVIEKPNAGWNAKPTEEDKTTGANIIRFQQLYVNILRQGPAKLSDEEFEKHWSQVETIIKSLTTTYNDKIAELKIKCKTKYFRST